MAVNGYGPYGSYGHTAHTAIRVLVVPQRLGEVVLRVRRQARVIDALDPGVLGEPLGDAAPVGVVLAHAQRQRLGAAQGQPAVERARHRAGAVLEEAEALGEVVAVGDEHPAD